MKSLLFYLSFSFLIIGCLNAQDEKAIEMATELPYYEIPAYPESYTAATVAARVVDGLGYRYYWATEGLTEKDLAYKPSEDGRTIEETLEHIMVLSNVVANVALQKPNTRGERETLSFAEKRKRTLENIKTVSDAFRKNSDESLEDFPIVFQRGEQKSEFPFWNLLNGQLADAIYHVGQIVSQRRAAGNPMDPRVNVFSGKNRE